MTDTHAGLPIKTERLLIRTLTKHDADNIFNLCSQREVTEWFPKWKMNREEAANFLNWLLLKNEHPCRRLIYWRPASVYHKDLRTYG